MQREYPIKLLCNNFSESTLNWRIKKNKDILCSILAVNYSEIIKTLYDMDYKCPQRQHQIIDANLILNSPVPMEYQFSQ